jgi:hypothetical protein
MANQTAQLAMYVIDRSPVGSAGRQATTAWKSYMHEKEKFRNFAFPSFWVLAYWYSTGWAVIASH